MFNLLSVPLKRTVVIPLKTAVREFLASHASCSHPDAFGWDISRWDDLRKNSSDSKIHVDSVDILFEYHAQLVFVLTKLPPNIGLEIPYTFSLVNTTKYVTLENLIYERLCILFNLAALCSQLASLENRSHADGLKRAIIFYQKSAGIFSCILESALPSFVQSVSHQQRPLEFTEAFLKALQHLMLAQGQECAWQRATMDDLKNGLIAKISKRISTLYETTLNLIRNSSPSVLELFPTEWMAHIEAKYHHFDAAAQYRKSIDDLEANRYGHEVARLQAAHTRAKTGYEMARRSLVSRPVLDDLKSLLDVLQKSLNRGERDNDLIYHHDVPPLSALPVIQEVSLTQSLIPSELLNPKAAVKGGITIFENLIGWGANVAIEIYRDRVQNWLHEEIINRYTVLDEDAERVLLSLNLPASLDALDKPIGLPQSLLGKAEDVRKEDGPSRVEKFFSNAELLAERIASILDEAMDLLDQEATDDERLQQKLSMNGVIKNRPSSHEANKSLTGEERHFREVLSQAAESDALVHAKWEEWEETIVRLTWKEEDLEKWVPSSTGSGLGKSTVFAETQKHARALRVHLETLEDLRRGREDLLLRIRRLTEADDIKPRILRESSAIESWVEVNPTMFEASMEQEMGKYEIFKEGIEANAAKQSELLKIIRNRHQLFIESRREDESVKERSHALQSLDLAYHKYKEISRNLDEGLQFYNNLAEMVSQFRDRCKEHVAQRRSEMNLSMSLDSLNLERHKESSATTPRRIVSKTDMTLPSIDSSEWEPMILQGPALIPNEKRKKPLHPRK